MNLVPQNPNAPDFDEVRRLTLMTIGEGSQSVYASVIDAWAAWCISHDIHPLSLTADNVTTYLAGLSTTLETRKRHLTIIRRLAYMLAAKYKHVDQRFSSFYDILVLIKAPTKNLAGEERGKRALAPEQVEVALSVWGGWRLLDIRNRAMIGLLFATGIRRSECKDLQWPDVDFTGGIVTIWHGKGDEYREVVIVGDYALQLLEDWQDVQFTSGIRNFIFCPVRKGDHLGGDISVTDKTVYNVVKETARRADLEFAPHDIRRTHITELLANDGLLADVQAQAGHTTAAMTLHYAQPVEAHKRRNRFKTRYEMPSD